MRILKGPRVLALVGATAGIVLLAGGTNAQNEFTIERPSSVLIFPKVVNQGDRDTCIQISNSLNTIAHVKCFYTDARLIGGEPLWLTTDFHISLTRQQPTTWCASTGRPVSGTDDQKGLDPGLVPPVTDGFEGSLVCVQVDATQGGAPTGGNSLVGKAQVGGGEYNAIGVPAVGAVNADDIVDMDGLEYAACPSGYYLNFPTEGNLGALALGSMMGQGLGDDVANVSTSVTSVPCDMDFRRARPSSLTIGFETWDEMEALSSGSNREITCWDTFGLGEYPEAFIRETPFGTARLEGVRGAGDAGFVAVSNVLRTGQMTGASDEAISNLHVTGTTVAAQIRLP
jgi:hypothetical protein